MWNRRKKDRYAGLLIDNHIDSDMRKVLKIRDNIASDGPGLYIMPATFDYYLGRGVLSPLECSDAYFLDFAQLKDTRRS